MILVLWLLTGCRSDPPASPAEWLTLPSSSGARAEVDAGRLRLRLRDAAGAVVMEGAPGGLRFRHGWRTRRPGPVMASERQTGRLELSVETPVGPGRATLEWRTPRSLEFRFEPPDRSRVRELCDAYRLRAGEAIYGLTERLTDSLAIGRKPPLRELIPDEKGTLDRRGESVEMVVRPTIALYAPFFHSSAGYGAYVETTSPGDFDVGDSDSDVLRHCFEAPSREAERELRVHFFLGDHRAIVDEYTALTGRPFVPPAWALRHWRWRDELDRGPTTELDGVEIQAKVAEDLAMYDRFGIPAGVYLFDRPWSEGDFGFETFRWDDARFPNKEAMFDALARRGWRLAIWSAALAFGENLDEAEEKGFLAPGSDRLLDLTNPQVRAWWIDQHVPFLRRWNVRAIKLDRGDEHIPSAAADVWHDGRDGRDMHNAYAALQTQVYGELLSKAWGPDHAFKMRAGWTGAQAHGMPWGGDTAAVTRRGKGSSTDLGLRSAIVSLQRAGFMGYAVWGSDTGGYFEFTDREVFARWLELSAFCPLMEIGGGGAHAPWDMPREPRFDQEMIDIYRRYVQLHHDLIPYFSRHAERAGRDGLPVARSLVFDYPQDPRAKDLWDQFLVGDNLLVAPVWRSGERRRQVYLPAGEWEDFWNRGDVVRGPATLDVEVPLVHIPIYVRAGATVLELDR